MTFFLSLNHNKFFEVDGLVAWPNGYDEHWLHL